jgi:hypothetical protein
MLRDTVSDKMIGSTQPRDNMDAHKRRSMIVTVGNLAMTVRGTTCINVLEDVLKSTASDDEQCMDEAAQGSLTDSIGKFHKKSRMRLAHLATQSTAVFT